MPKTQSTYKYSKSELTDLLIDKGSIRIGTLHNFRKSEYGRGIDDPEEGKKRVIHKAGDFSYDASGRVTGSEFDYNATQAFGARFEVGPRGSIKVFGGTFGKNLESPNFYLFCSSSDCSLETMRQFEDADACAKINNLSDFYAQITLNIIETAQIQVEFLGIHEINYTERTESWNGTDWGTHPALIKAPKFAPQHEVRAVWRPLKNEPIKPFDFVEPKLSKFCTRVHPQ